MSKTIGVILALKDKCSPQLKQIADKMGITEKEAKRLNSQVQKASKQLGGDLKNACVVGAAAIGAMVASTAVLIDKTVETTSRINDMSARIGISKQAFQQWDYIMQQNGGDVEALQVGMKKLVGQIVGVNTGNKASIKMFKALGVSVKDSTGHLKNQEQIFDEVMVALQKMPDGIMKAKIASDLFGKSGAQLMPILGSNSASISALKDEYKKLGIAISDETIEAGDNLGDTFDKLKTTFGVIGVVMSSQLVPVIQDLANKLLTNMPQVKATVLPIFQGLGNIVGFVIEHFQGLTVVGSAIVSTFIAFNVINGVISMIKTLQMVIEAVSAAQGIWNALMLANPVGAVAVGIGLLVGGIVLLWQNWDKVTGAVKRAFSWMKKAVGIVPSSGVSTTSAQATPVVKKHATGTAFSTGGTAVVGEFGKEIVNLPKGASVTPANKTQKLLGGLTINMPITIKGNMIGNNEFLTQIENRFALKLQTALQAV